MSTVVVGIFVVAKFTEGAWLIVVIFPLLVLGLMKLNKKYRDEASVLEMSLTEHVDLARHPRLQVLVFVDTIDLAEIEAMRLGNGLHADEITAVHFVLDVDHAMRLRERWDRFEHDTPLWLINCPDRHLSRASHELIWRVLNDHPDTRVTVCCRGEHTRRCWAGYFTTAPRTGWPALSAASGMRPRSSCPTTSNRGLPGWPLPTGSETGRLKKPTRSRHRSSAWWAISRRALAAADPFGRDFATVFRLSASARNRNCRAVILSRGQDGRAGLAKASHLLNQR